ATTSAFAQTISGKIETKTGEKIAYAQITLKDSVNTFQIKEFGFAHQGFYQIQPKKTYKQLVVEVNAMGYRKALFVIEDFQPMQNYVHDFVLEVETKLLDEVVITAPKRFEQKDDTTSFVVQAYKDGTERKIEDLIKKLPDVEVNDRTGQIKYKGKPIETVKLDGDNLFDENYAIGTRNIDVDLVEQVQVLENYSENPLLKGVENSDKVALNLVLKKTAMKYSGNAEANWGLFLAGRNTRPAVHISANVLGISNRFKSFATASYNNIGINRTPFDYADYAIKLDNAPNTNLTAPIYIPDAYFNIGIDLRRNNFNNTLFGSYNALFKPNKRFSIKVNLLYLNDKITLEQFSRNDLSFGNEKFTTTDTYNWSKVPNRYVGRLELQYRFSQKALLEYKVNFDAERINTTNNVLQNDSLPFRTQLATRPNFLKQLLTYTYRLSKTQAFQFVLTQAFHQTPQDFLFSPAVFSPQIYANNTQRSLFEKNYIEAKAQLLGKKGRETLLDRDKNKYDISIGSLYYTTDFTTALQGNVAQATQNIPNFDNHGQYQRFALYASGNYKWVIKRLVIQPSFRASSLKQTLQNKQDTQLYEANNLIFEPSLSLRYKLTSIAGISASAGYKQNPFSEDYFVPNAVYLSNRSIRANEISLNLQNQQFLSLSYGLGDLAHFFRFSLGGMLSQNVGNYFNRLEIQPNSTRTTTFFLPEGVQNQSLFMLTEKYIHALQSTLRWRSNYTISDYKNFVGNSALRHNRAITWANEVFFKTALDFKVNFENVFRYNLNATQVENGAYFENRSLTNTLQIIVKPTEKMFLHFSQDFFWQNIQNPKSKYYFADVSFRYTTSKITWQFLLRNATNTCFFSQFFVNDFSTYLHQTNLLPRHFLVNSYLSF
ncbi:MAG: carboxypeptidase-like regulatory domain-containing protein, partial [Microscillaceae bacterium]|nr:carboxypeptidase-like regulatory domain-containing protein [Microscillaceae bacterium]MDW8460739.1 hypothetical protein [Cytophagales bacterium]